MAINFAMNTRISKLKDLDDSLTWLSRNSAKFPNKPEYEVLVKSLREEFKSVKQHVHLDAQAMLSKSMSRFDEERG